MKIYWSLKSVPELAELKASERRRTHRECWVKHRKEICPVWLPSLGGSGFVLGYFAVGGLMHLGLLQRDLFVAVGFGAVIGIVSGFIGFQRIVHRLRPFYAEHFRSEPRANE